MAFLPPGVILQSGLPPMSEMVGPEALMITSITVALLGIAVMMLTRPRTEVAAAGENASGQGTPELVDEIRPETQIPRPNHTVLEVRETEPLSLSLKSEPADKEIPSPATSLHAEKAPEPNAAPMAHRPSCGTSSLMAKVASLLPAGVAMPRGAERPSGRSGRAGSGFHPGARFSRAQQAFLHIPIVLTGKDENGADFREETSTLILLPQGAVIPMRQKVRAGDRMMLSNPSRQKEAECQVYGAQTGPDGRLLVEVDFCEETSMWPVSFPAWSAPSRGAAPGSTRS